MKKTLLTIFSVLFVFTVGCSNSKEESEISSESSVSDTEDITSEPTEPEEIPDESSDTISESEPKDESGSPAGGTLIAYFSVTGITKDISERIASLTDADLYEIIPAESYSPEDLDWRNENSRVSIEREDLNARPEIASGKISLDSYSTVYIGYPIWRFDAPRIMSTFVESYDFDGKTVIPFCTSSSSPIGESGTNLEFVAQGGNWLEGGRIDSAITDDELQEWINNMK
ncbi:MAG: flavodoxin [Ruminococcus sp.]|nr:flavodoxin [Ruminococcus sp.]